MLKMTQQWFKTHFSDPDAIYLLIILLGTFLVIEYLGHMLAPVLVSIVFAYLLQGLVTRLERWKIPHILAVSGVFILFFALVITALFIIFPIMLQQLSNLINDLPRLFNKTQLLLTDLTNQYSDYISADELQNIIAASKNQIARFGKVILSFSLSSIPGLIQIIIYLVIVPMLVFFFLMDKNELTAWFSGHIPDSRRLIRQVWDEVNQQIGNYVRGKVIETIVVSIVTFIAFAVMGLHYSMLLSVLVGLSSLIPFVGAAIVTVPVLIVAFMQWGWGPDLLYLVIAYAIIITLDANVLVPILFSEAVNLHPVAIILAILIFGGVWGFWGVFFAIPLATLVKAVLNAWPSLNIKQTTKREA